MTTQANCQRCNGTGIYTGTRRDGSTYEGPCFSCQGGGPLSGAPRRGYGYRPSRYVPAAQAAAIVAPQAAPAALPQADRDWTPRQRASVLAFATAEPAAYGWLIANRATSDFAASLLNGVARYGNLTPRQLAAVMRNCSNPVAVAPVVVATPVAAPDESNYGAPMAQQTAPLANIRTVEADEARRAAEAARAAPVAVARVMVNLSLVRAAMDAARASGLRKVRLNFGNVQMRLSGPSFRTGGAGMILCYFEGRYLGYVDGENVFKPRLGSTVSESAIEAFRAVGLNPRAAAATHGHDTGNCACCNRLLTDPPSVMAGIGPVCIRRFGWSF